METIYQTDPDAPSKLRRRLEYLEGELRAIQAQDRRARALGHPKNPPRMADSLRSRIRQTRLRLEQLSEDSNREEGRRS